MDRREQETLDKLREKAADTEIPETLKPEQIRRMLDEKEPGTEDVKKRKNRTWKACMLAAACAAVVSLAVWKMPGVQRDLPDQGNAGASDGKNKDSGRSEEIICAEDYPQIYDCIKAYQESIENSYSDESIIKHEEFYVAAEAETADTGGSEGAAAAEDGAAMAGSNGNSSRKTAESAAMDEAAGNASGDYSETNVRQEGVDEADIVKTDGRYLYVLEDNNKEIAVVDTQGQELKKAASIKMEDKGEDCRIYEFYVMPDTKKLVLICSADNQYIDRKSVV